MAMTAGAGEGGWVGTAQQRCLVSMTFDMVKPDVASTTPIEGIGYSYC